MELFVNTNVELFVNTITNTITITKFKYLQPLLGFKILTDSIRALRDIRDIRLLGKTTSTNTNTNVLIKDFANNFVNDFVNNFVNKPPKPPPRP